MVGRRTAQPAGGMRSRLDAAHRAIRTLAEYAREETQTHADSDPAGRVSLRRHAHASKTIGSVPKPRDRRPAAR